MFSLAQEENLTSFYVSPTTLIVGTDEIFVGSKDVAPEQIDQNTLYVVKNTILVANDDVNIVSIENYNALVELESVNVTTQSYRIAKSNLRKKSKTVAVNQVVQFSPFGHSSQQNQNQIKFAIFSIVNASNSSFFKPFYKFFPNKVCFEWEFDFQRTICNNEWFYATNNILFQIQFKYCNRPPPYNC